MLEIKNVSKTFGKNEVLKNINLKIKKGERIAIIGPSGSGKSTLLRCMNLLEVPSKGKIIFEGEELNNKNIEEKRKKIGMVFQSFYLFENLTVIENLLLAPKEAKLYSKEEAIKKAESLLKEVDLYDKKEDYPNTLSGGQKQRIAIIRSLMMNPDIMLFDEPTSALDPEMIEDILNLMMTLAHREVTMIVVTHEMNFTKKFATRILFMDEGEIVEEGTKSEIFSHPKSKRLQTFLSKINI